MTMATVKLPLFSLLGLFLLHAAPTSIHALVPVSSRGRSNNGGSLSQSTRQQTTESSSSSSSGLLQQQDESFIGHLQEYTDKLLDPEHTSLAEENSSTPIDIIPILSAWAKTESVKGAETAERIMLRLKHNDASSITNRHYTIVMDAWGKAGNAKKASFIFETMEQLAVSNPAVAPNRVSYNVIINAHAKSGDIETALRILTEMETSDRIQPISYDYNILLGAFARTGNAPQVEMLMKRMVGRCQLKETTATGGYESTYCDCAPDLISYNLLLDAHAKSGDSNAGKRAQEILAAWKMQYEAEDLQFLPDVRSYTAVMQAVVRSEQNPDTGIVKAKALLEESKVQGIENDLYLVVALMDAYASIRDPKAVDEAEQLLDQLEEQGRSNAIAYNTVLKIWKGSRRADALERAEAIVKRMEDRKIANTISYTTIIGVLASVGDKASAERATEILEHMQDAYEQGNVAVQPNVQTYNSIMNVWLQCGEVKRAEQLLQQLEQLQKDGGSLRPNVVSYSTVMNGYARSGEADAVLKTEQVFDRMQAVYEDGNKAAQPNMHSYVTLINAYLKSDDPNAAPKAEGALFQLYDDFRKHGNVDLKPNFQLITTVIDCWQRSGMRDAGEKAEAILDWMIALYKEDEDEDFEPNAYTFSSTITAWSKSRKLGKATKARAVLQTMIDMHESGVLAASPNEHCYTAVINSCAYCVIDDNEKRNSLQIAIRTYKELVSSKHGSPNEVTYSTFLTALRNLLPQSKERAAAAKSVFESATKAGRVNNLVIRRLQSILSPRELEEVLTAAAISDDGQVRLDRIPNDWRRNVATGGGQLGSNKRRAPFGRRS